MFRKIAGLGRNRSVPGSNLPKSAFLPVLQGKGPWATDAAASRAVQQQEAGVEALSGALHLGAIPKEENGTERTRGHEMTRLDLSTH